MTPLKVVLLTFLFAIPLVPTTIASYVFSAFLALVFCYLFISTRNWTVSGNPALWVLLAAQMYALLFHLDDSRSILGIFSFTIEFLAVYLVMQRALRRHGLDQTEYLLFKVLAISIVIMFPLSTALTAVHWPTAPGEYFWQVSSGQDAVRLELMGGHNDTGGSGSYIIWILGTAMLLNEKLRRGWSVSTARGLAHTLFLTLGSVALIFTGARLALLYLLNVLMQYLSYRRLLSVWLIALINVTLAGGYLALCFSPALSLVVGDVLFNLQRQLPEVRLTSDASGAKAQIFSGRDVLNVRLAEESGDHPWIGEGRSSAVLQTGVDQNGNIADEDNKVANGESGLRILVAFGYPYFILTLLFILYPTILALRGRLPDPQIACAASGCVLLSFVATGGFENFAGATLILAVSVLLYSIPEPAQETVSPKVQRAGGLFQTAAS